MVQKITHFSLDTIKGLFDADGSYEAKVYVGTQKPISFHVNIIFTQKHLNVLQAVIKSLITISGSGNPLKITSQRTTINQSGTTSISYSISIAFSNPMAKGLLGFWHNNPPKAPTKLLDFRIACILAEINKFTALQVVNKYLPNNSIQNERIASLALLWLRFCMFGKVKDTANPKLIPIESYYSQLNATQAEIQQSVAIGQQLFAPIKQEWNASTLSSQVFSDDYLLGYHIGDGSFQITTEFGSNGRSFKGKFFWTVTDCTQNLALLESIQKQLGNENISSGIVDYGTWKRLTVTGIENCKKLAGRWKNKRLSSVRQNQYDCFNKALELYSVPTFRQDLVKLEDFIHLKWIMNPGTNTKKKGSEEEDLVKVRIYFNNQPK